MCYDEGILQAFLDGEVGEEEHLILRKHLDTCARCRTILKRLREDWAFADGRLTAYLTGAGLSGISAPGLLKTGKRSGPAVSRPVTPGYNTIKKGVLPMMAKYRKAAVAAVAVIALATSLSFDPVRTFAGDLLNIFRVEKVQVITLNQEDIASMEKAVREGTGRVDMADFGRVEFSGKRSKEPVSQDQAQAGVDFGLQLPASLPDGYNLKEMLLTPAGEAAYTLNTDKTNEVLRSLGSTKLLPSELNGKTFTMKAPAVVEAVFNGPDGARFTVVQSRSPELQAPGGADVGAIRDALLSLPFLPESLRSQLASVNDWQHTFLVPNVEGSSREVSVAGAQGVFITPPAGGSHRQAGVAPGVLLWQKGGVVYGVYGALNQAQALEIAASLK